MTCRSYYRCSSLKGCLARKQVEESCNDAGKFIITYSGEHSHSQPTRRSSLAGTNRHKFTAAKTMGMCTATNNSTTHDKGSSSCSPTSDITEEVVILQKPIINDEQIVEGIISHEDINDFGGLSDMIFNDDFFTGLEDFDAVIPTSSPYDYCSMDHFR